MRQGWGGRPVRQEQAQGILIAGLGMLAGHFGYERAARGRAAPGRLPAWTGRPDSLAHSFPLERGLFPVKVEPIGIGTEGGLGPCQRIDRPTGPR